MVALSSPLRPVPRPRLLGVRPRGLLEGSPHGAAGWPPCAQPWDSWQAPRGYPCPSVRPVTLPSVASGLVTASVTASVTPPVCVRTRMRLPCHTVASWRLRHMHGHPRVRSVCAAA